MSKWKVGKTYPTRDGSEGMVLGDVNGKLFGCYRVTDNHYIPISWDAETGFLYNFESAFDLLPAEPEKVTGEIWLNVYNDWAFSHTSREEADNARMPGDERKACVRIIISAPDGYGLDEDQPALKVSI